MLNQRTFVKAFTVANELRISFSCFVIIIICGCVLLQYYDGVFCLPYQFQASLFWSLSLNFFILIFNFHYFMGACSIAMENYYYDKCDAIKFTHKSFLLVTKLDVNSMKTDTQKKQVWKQKNLNKIIDESDLISFFVIHNLRQHFDMVFVSPFYI